MTALGVVFRPHLPPEQLRSVAEAAEESGLEQLWLWEDFLYHGGVATAAAALAWTERVRIGVGVMPVPFRNVAAAATETATLERMFPGRFILGVGHGNQKWMAQAGARVDSPMTLLREHLDAMRALLRGERVSTTGRYVTLDDVVLDRPPATVATVFVGAEGPRSLRLSGAAADGTVLSEKTPPDGVRKARQLIDEGRAEAGRTDRHELVVYLQATTGPNAQRRLTAEFERYKMTGIPGLGAAGSAEAVAEAVERLVDAGADTVILVPTTDEIDIEGFVRFAAHEVRPLVR
jgi:alkanesulfonate monooxygenase SsuD/methylene tetrahydromethanopterin reductase-like flavin-dependent oxidoreductase (luciferase family)